MKHKKIEGAVVLEYSVEETEAHAPHEWWVLRKELERQFDTIVRMTVESGPSVSLVITTLGDGPLPDDETSKEYYLWTLGFWVGRASL